MLQTNASAWEYMVFPLEKKLVSQGGDKFKKWDSIQNFSIVALNTELLQKIYHQKSKNTQNMENIHFKEKNLFLKVVRNSKDDVM